MKNIKTNRRHVLKNGSVFVDGRFIKTDLIVENGVIAQISPEFGGIDDGDTKVIDCSNFFISPGWVDLHCHLGGIGVDLDRLGPEMGVTAIVEAGTYGPETVDGLMNRYLKRSTIPVYVFLNLRKTGIRYSDVLFKSKPGVDDVDGARRLIDCHPQIIRGFKVRLDAMNSPP
jgi:dihydroorotase